MAVDSADDELLALEELEGLLDADDDGFGDEMGEMGGPAKTHDDEKAKSDEKICEAASESNDDIDNDEAALEAFLNAASDSDDDDDNANKGESNTIVSAKKAQSTWANNESPKSKKNNTSPSPSKTGSNQNNNKQKQNEDSSVDPTTKALKEEMARMKKQMETLQNMLAMKMQDSLPSEHQNVSPESKKSSTPSRHHSSSSKDVKHHSPAQSKKVFQEQLEKGSSTKKPSLKLMSDNGDNLFFDSTSTKKITKQIKDVKKDKQSILDATTAKQSTKPIKEVNKEKECGAKQLKKAESLQKMREKALFGDSDSDWDDMDGEDKRTLNEQGKELKRIMNSQNSRVAHQPKFGSVDSGSSGSTQSWTRYYSEMETDADKAAKRKIKKEPEKHVKNALQCRSSSSDQANSVKSSFVKEEEPSVTEDFSRIRIINPLISSSLMKMRMEGRKMISIPRIRLKVNTQDMQGDWVTIGAVVHKSDAKTSASGKTYAIWKLNDLEDLENSASFFLFGEVYKQLWKTEVGTVIGVLNPSMMESSEKSNGGEPAFTIKNPSQMMVMGRSKDLAWCISLTKGGNKCCKFINRRQGDHCSYHVQAAYKKSSATRLELHGSVTGVKPKSFEKRIFKKDAMYMYGGQAFVPHSRQESGKSKKNVTLNKLQQSMTEGRYQKINTLSIHEIKPKTQKSAGGKIKEEPDDTFVEMLAVPSPGAMQLVASMKNQAADGARGKSASKSGSPAVAGHLGSNVQSVTATELMKKHKQELDERRRQAKLKRSLVDPLLQMPQLGKGFASDQEIVLGGSSRPSTAKADATKLKAIAAVRKKGGLDKLDPNAIKKTGEKIQEKIKKRVETDCASTSPSSPNSGDDRRATTSTNHKRSPSSSGESTSRSPSSKPPKKKSKLLGDVDLNSDEFKSIMKARSKHKGVLAQAESEREEAYFAELEKKEKLEEKMESVTSIEIQIVTCKTCMYTAQSAKDSCKKEGHTLKRRKGKKRFFKCKKCKERTSVIDAKFPTESCRKCGATSYEKTSMCPIRKGPTLESEVLNLRGDEIKYLSSLNQKVYLNTVIDD